MCTNPLFEKALDSQNIAKYYDYAMLKKVGRTSFLCVTSANWQSLCELLSLRGGTKGGNKGKKQGIGGNAGGRGKNRASCFVNEELRTKHEERRRSRFLDRKRFVVDG